MLPPREQGLAHFLSLSSSGRSADPPTYTVDPWAQDEVASSLGCASAEFLVDGIVQAPTTSATTTNNVKYIFLGIYSLIYRHC